MRACAGWLRPASGGRADAARDWRPATSTTASAMSRSRRSRPCGTVPLYLDTVKLEPLRNGNAVLRQKVGTTKLQTDSDGGQLSVLCNIEVKKNRITSVTVSVASRPAALPVRPGQRHRCGRRAAHASGRQVPGEAGDRRRRRRR